MKLNRVDKVAFLYKGKQTVLKLRFAEYIYNKVPVYCSYDIDSYDIIEFKSGEVIVVINDRYMDSFKSSNIMIGITDKLLRYSLNTNDNNIIDLHLVHYYGYKNTLNYIRGNDNRVRFVERIVNSGKTLNIIALEDVVHNIKSIEVVEVENQA